MVAVSTVVSTSGGVADYQNHLLCKIYLTSLLSSSSKTIQDGIQAEFEVDLIDVHCLARKQYVSAVFKALFLVLYYSLKWGGSNASHWKVIYSTGGIVLSVNMLDEALS